MKLKTNNTMCAQTMHMKVELQTGIVLKIIVAAFQSK